MILSELLMLFVGAGGVEPGDPPSGAPSALTSSYHSVNLVRLQWTNGDVSAYTRVYRKLNGCAGDETLYDAVVPGVSVLDTGVVQGGSGQAVVTGWVVRHFKSGTESDDSNCVETVEGDQE